MMRRYLSLSLLVSGCGAGVPDAEDTDRTVDDTAPVETDVPEVSVRPEVSAEAPSLVFVGDAVQLQATTNGRDARWDLGDGEILDGEEITHTYMAPGNYVATVQVVGDGGLKATDSVRVSAVLHPAAAVPVTSSTIALDPALGTLWVVVPETRELAVLSLVDQTADHVDACDTPVAVAIAGDEVAVACAGDDSLVVLSRTSRTVTRTIDLGVGAHPEAVAGRAGTWVVSTRAGQVLRIEGTAPPTVALDVPDPGAVGLDADGGVVAARRRADNVGSELYRTAGSIPLARDPGPDSDTTNRGVLTNAHALAISPDGGTAYVGGTLANVDRGLWVERDADPKAGTFETTLRASVRVLDLDAGEEDFIARKQLDNHGQVNAMAVTPSGNWLYTAHQGTHTILRLDAYTLRRAGAVLDAGHGITGITTSVDGDTLYVNAWLDREVCAYDVSDPSASEPPQTWCLPTVTSEPLSAELLSGKRIFHDTTDRRMTKDGYLTCNACHPDGRDDGMVWDFTHRGEGLRNTTTLEGRAGTAMGPVHWTGNFDEIQDFEHDIRGPQAGEGFLTEAEFQAASTPLGPHKAGRSADLDALAAYVASLATTPTSPYDEPSTGAALFADKGCDTCHGGPLYTDSVVTPDPADFVRHDIGTVTPSAGQRLGDTLDGFDTPTLLGTWSTGPYLHDGSAASIEQAIHAHEGGEAATLVLSDDEVDVLAAFVRSL